MKSPATATRTRTVAAASGKAATASERSFATASSIDRRTRNSSTEAARTERRNLLTWPNTCNCGRTTTRQRAASAGWHKLNSAREYRRKPITISLRPKYSEVATQKDPSPPPDALLLSSTPTQIRHPERSVLRLYAIRAAEGPAKPLVRAIQLWVFGHECIRTAAISEASCST